MREKEGGTDPNESMYGISTTNIDRTVTGSTGKDMITVITTLSSIKKDDILAKMKTARKMEKFDYDDEKVKDGKYVILKQPKGSAGLGVAFCVVDSKTVLFSHDFETIKGVLNRDKAPDWSSSMETAIKKASF